MAASGPPSPQPPSRRDFIQRLSSSAGAAFLAAGWPQLVAATAHAQAVASRQHPPQLRDAWGLPAIRVTFQDHPQAQRLYRFFLDRSLELLHAAGAQRTWTYGLETPSAVHLLGTCRMGKNRRTSVTDPSHRTHDVRNLFIVDGSSLVTGGRGQPTMTIQALAFRASDLITQLARSGALT